MTVVTRPPQLPTAEPPKPEGATPKPLFEVAGVVTFASLPQDGDAMCVWDGDAVVCTPSTKDEG